ncbi:hydroxyisourate hydrolase [Streptomyces sp. NPDC004752]
MSKNTAAPRQGPVSTHILDTGIGRPAEGVAVRIAVRAGRDADWRALGGSVTDADGRCGDLPAPPEGTTHVRLDFEVEAYFAKNASRVNSASSAKKRADAQQDAPANRDSGADVFFPEVAVTFAVHPGEHYHVPLLLTPFGYSVYRGS